MDKYSGIQNISNMSVNDQIEYWKNDKLLDDPSDDNLEIKAKNREISYLLERKKTIKWLSGFEIKYHLTITFNMDMNEFHSERYANELFKMIRYEYFGSKNKRKDFLNGFVVRERQANQSIHYHILILDHGVFKKKNRKDFRSVVKDKVKRIIHKFIDKNGREKGRHPIDPVRGYFIQDYFDGNLEEYLTKSLESKRLSFEFIAPLEFDGFKFPEKSPEVSFVKRSYHDSSRDGECRSLTFQEMYQQGLLDKYHRN